MTMSAVASQPQLLRAAAVWGTTVIALRVLKRGRSFELGDHPEAVLPIPDGLAISPKPLRAVPGGWELDPRGAVAGIVLLRGRTEDAAALGNVGAPIPIMPGDYGLVQYGLFSVFFQYTSEAKKMTGMGTPEVLAVLSLFASGFLHMGAMGLLRTLTTPDAIPKPLELTNPEEYAARFGLHRPLQSEPVPPEPAVASDGGGKGVKDPGAHDKKDQGGGRKIQGTEGKFGLNGAASKTELPGEPKPTTKYGGLSEVLEGDTGKEIQQTLKSINTVADALKGLNGKDLVLGGGSGTGLKGAGPGGGGNGAGIAFGAGTMDTGFGQGKGGGLGGGNGGPGGRGNGGPGGGGNGGNGAGGNGAGAGAPGERKISVAAGSGSSRGGLTAEQVRHVVMARTGALRACYESEAQRNPNLAGGVTVQWQIDPSGQVSSASIASSTMGNPRVEGCVVRQVRAWRFPSADAPTTVGAYPFKFGIGG
ncbi:MAG: AgmX/PglI C-terminal domain-containing protein [Polyangiaceae bacterium]